MSKLFMPWLITQFRDANDNPLSGGKVYAYQAGTTTPQVTYNYTGTANLHPVILDGSGCGEIKLDDTLPPYDVVVKDSNGALVRSYPSVSFSSGGGSSGVTSVNGDTGPAVILDAGDIGALPITGGTIDGFASVVTAHTMPIHSNPHIDFTNPYGKTEGAASRVENGQGQIAQVYANDQLDISNAGEQGIEFLNATYGAKIRTTSGLGDTDITIRQTYASESLAYLSDIPTVITNHNTLSGKQGGTTAEFYHLTAAETLGVKLAIVTRTGSASTEATTRTVRYMGTGGHIETLPTPTSDGRLITFIHSGSGVWTVDGEDIYNGESLTMKDSGQWEII